MQPRTEIADPVAPIAAPAAAPPVRRDAARVLLLDEDDRLLLFRGCDPHRPERPFWFTAGGGLDPGETARECAVREVREETGLTGLVLGRLVWRRVAVFSWAGVRYEQHEQFFLARCTSFAVDTSGFTAAERLTHTEHRWWTLPQLAATADELAPADLPARLAELLRDGPPPEPVTVAGATLP